MKLFRLHSIYYDSFFKKFSPKGRIFEPRTLKLSVQDHETRLMRIFVIYDIDDQNVVKKFTEYDPRMG